jgi:hypothetical protein
VNGTTPSAARAGFALAALLTLTACVPQGLAFRTDTRVKIVAPKNRSTVSLPVSLSWRVHDFSGTFAVFVDASPVPPGKKVAWVARHDGSCLQVEGCPDAAYLAERGVYTTTGTTLTLEKLPSANVVKGRERHRATIILLGASGARQGESAFEVAFEVERGKTS